VLFRHMVKKALLMLASQPSWDLLFDSPLELPFDTAAVPVLPNWGDLSELWMLTKIELTRASQDQ